MKRILLISFVLLSSLISEALAQRTVSGKVTSGADGEGLPGVTVQAKGTSTGVITDLDGNYRIQVPQDANTLVFSFVGFKEQEIQIGNRSVIDVTLQEDIKSLEEVVVTAQGFQREQRSLGFSTQKIESEELIRGMDRSPLNAMQGKVAGAQISSASGAPGASTRVIIRGLSSLSGSNQPLYVIDGVPMDNSQTGDESLNMGYDFGNRANDINPADIESITVLKGTNATTLYGSRGANGVIVITTKSGKDAAARGKKMEVTYNGSLTFDNILKVPELQNRYGQGWEGRVNLEENTSWGPLLDGEERVWGRIIDNEQRIRPFEAVENNVRNFFETGVTYNNSISLGGGNDQTNYYASYSNVATDGIMPSDADNFSRHTFAVRAGTKLANNLRSDASLNYVRNESSFVYTGQELGSVLNNVWQTPRNISYSELADYNNKFNDLEGYYTPYGLVNPYFALNEYGNRNTSDRIFGNFQLGYDFTDFLKLNWRLGTDLTSQRVTLWEPVFEITGPNSQQSNTGSYDEIRLNRTETTSNVNLIFSPQVSDVISINTILGWEYNVRQSDRVETGVSTLRIPEFYNLSNSDASPTASNEESLRRYSGVYASLDLSYNEYLYLTLQARNDWSSTLPAGNRSFFYPAANLSFVFSDAFNLNSNVFSYGKLRGGWGQSGNDPDPYQVFSVFVQGEHSDGYRDLRYPLPGNIIGFSQSNRIGNLNLQPEITTEVELGADLRFFDDRINLDFTWYDRRVTDLIYDVPLSSTTGFTVQTMNLGEISNKGIEVLLGFTPIRTNDFNWNFSINFTNNKNKLVSLNENLKRVTLGGLGNLPFVAVPGREIGLYEGIVPLKDPSGNIVVDDNGLPRVAPDPEIIGASQHDFITGLNNNFTYKGLSFNFTVDWRQGGQFYSRTADIMYFTGNTPITLYNDRKPFVIPGSVIQVLDESGDPVLDDSGDPIYVKNNTPISHDHNSLQQYWSDGGSGLDKSFIIDRSFVKLRELALGYQLPTGWISRSPFGQVRVGLVGRNLFIWTPKENIFSDPEQTTFGNDLEASYGDFGATPTTRSYGFTLRATF